MNAPLPVRVGANQVVGHDGSVRLSSVSWISSGKSTWFAPTLTGKGAFKDVYSVMANWGANHGVTVYGHVGGELITLASMLRIPVNMHNVDENEIFRPHCWAAFGTDDTQAADYSACKTYGPLYK